MVGSRCALRRLGRLGPQAAQYNRLVLDVLERLENVRHFRQGPLRLRHPPAGTHAVRKEEAHKAAFRRDGRCLGQRRRGRHHRIEQRERESDAGAPQEGSARNVSPGDKHRGGPLFPSIDREGAGRRCASANGGAAYDHSSLARPRSALALEDDGGIAEIAWAAEPRRSVLH